MALVKLKQNTYAKDQGSLAYSLGTALIEFVLETP